MPKSKPYRFVAEPADLPPEAAPGASIRESAQRAVDGAARGLRRAHFGSDRHGRRGPPDRHSAAARRLARNRHQERRATEARGAGDLEIVSRRVPHARWRNARTPGARAASAGRGSAAGGRRPARSGRGRRGRYRAPRFRGNIAGICQISRPRLTPGPRWGVAAEAQFVASRQQAEINLQTPKSGKQHAAFQP